MSRSGLPVFPVITLGQDGLWHEDEYEQAYIGTGERVQEVKIRKNGGIAVILLTLTAMKHGPNILNSPNGVPAPSRNLLES